MDTTSVVIIVILLLALLFFGYTSISQNFAEGSKTANSYPSGQYIIGGGCGR